MIHLLRSRLAQVAIAVLALVALGTKPAVGQPAGTPKVLPAVDGILSAFKSRPLVGVGDQHNLAALGALYVSLIGDPRFARDVGNLVVEFGGSAQQDVIDRYVAGEPVSPSELRHVWSEVVGWEPGELGQMYVDVFAAVRRANASLPKEQQIRVWLGEPPIDWGKIHSPDDLMPLMEIRDAYPAKLILQQILGRRRKALVIYGGLHFFSPPPMPTGLRELVERERPQSFYLVTVYRGLATAECSHRFEYNAKTWGEPVLAAPIGGTWLEGALREPACAVKGPTLILPPGETIDPSAETRRSEAVSGVLADGLIYLGPASQLVQAPSVNPTYLDEGYLAEMARRKALLDGDPQPPPPAP